MKIGKHILLTHNQVLHKIKGGSNLIEHKFRYKNETYTVLVNKDKTHDDEVEYTIAQQLPNPTNKPECVRGEINDDVLYIASIQKFKACVSPTIDAYQGIVLSRFLIKLMKKEHPHITSVELTDNASIHCRDKNKTRIVLSDMMLLTHGHSYYDLIGMKPKERKDNEYYRTVKKVIKTIIWDPNILKSLLKYNNIKLPHKDTPFHDAMKYMFKNHCDDMAPVMRSYMKVLGIPESLHGFQYIKKFM
jgi:hypothetical protein